ncbi:MAG: pyridoxal kinase [Fusobacteria bacterium]|nr:pyridoxal kinase [Fusobacteriota bacterium]
MRALSFNSHVSYGSVGHNVTMFSAQEYEVALTAIHTVNFSNHPGYGNFFGEWISEEVLEAQINMLDKIGVLSHHDAILSGYLGKVETINIIEKVVKKLKLEEKIEYFLDPVMGDSDKGLYVSSEIAQGIKERLLPLADFIMPNVFELEYLTGETLNSVAEIKNGCRKLLEKYSLQGILVTSVENLEKIGILYISKTECFESYSEKFHFDFIPRGSGDYISALFMANKILGEKNEKVVEKLSSIIYNSFKLTYEKKEKELFLYSEKRSK